MNILPFVTLLIFVISLVISSFFQGYKESSLSKLGFTGALHASRLARNDAEHAKFKASLPKLKSEESNSKPPSGKKKKSFRDQITDNSKFNLSPLLKTDTPFLEEVFANLLHELYPDFPTQALAKELLLSMKKMTDPFTLEEVLLPQADLNHYWYKMLKGSPGWPSISHYILFKKEKEVIIATKASIPLLKAFFGNEITDAILLLESNPERKRAPIKKNELPKILTDLHFPIERQSFISYGKSSTVRKTSLRKDPSTGIPATVSYSVKDETTNP